MNCHKKKWFISPEFLIRKLLQRHHNDPHASHFDQIKTLVLLKKQYSWPELFQKIKKYCDLCITCHRMKFVKHESYELMKFLPQSQAVWTDVIMVLLLTCHQAINQKPCSTPF